MMCFALDADRVIYVPLQVDLWLFRIVVGPSRIVNSRLLWGSGRRSARPTASHFTGAHTAPRAGKLMVRGDRRPRIEFCQGWK